MEKRKGIIFNTFNFIDTKSPDSIYKAFASSSYTDEKGYGLKKIDLEDEVLSATLIKRTATFINYYNVAIEDFEKKQIFIFVEVQFIIDFELQIICVFGSANSLSMVKAALRSLLPDTFQISLAQLTAYSLYEIIKKKKIRFKIEEITIQNFLYQNSIIGRYSGRVTNSKSALDIIQEYKDDLSKLVVTIYPDNVKDFAITLGNNGVIAISCEEEDFNENFHYLKNIIFK